MIAIPATTALALAIYAGAILALIAAAMIGAGIGAGLAALAQFWVLSQYPRGGAEVR